MKKIFLLSILILILNSCAFIFYDYRGQLDTEYTILNTSKDTSARITIGKLIFNLAKKENFYTRKSSQTFDSLYFYGPDYHSFKIRVQETNDTIKVHLRYAGHHGFRSRPPHKQFIQMITDSLTYKFKATQIINVNISNEKK